MAKIIIIEDNELVADVYKRKLQKEGHQVEISRDGEQGLKTIYSIKPDLLLVDLMLPGMSGLDVIKALREDEEFENLQIVAFSTSQAGELLSAVKQANVNLVLTKANNSPKKIIEKIKELLVTSQSNSASLSNETATEAIYTIKDDKPTRSGSLGRILVVEDDPLVMMMVTDVIEKEGFTVVTAQDGREAYKILEKDANFIAGVFDVIMPYIHGPDLVRYMRTEKRLMNIPVIMITADQSIRTQFDSFDAGAVLFLRKPFKRTKLKNLFSMIVTRQIPLKATGA
jgi:CheY-like chemotaxis protein